MQRKQPTYPGSLVAECRRMADGGWSAYRIHKMLQERGLDPCPSHSTVLYWTDEARSAKHRARTLRQQAELEAASASFRLSGRSPQYRVAFMRRLAAEGVPSGSIAKVHRVVFGASINDGTVRKVLREGARA